MPTFAESSSVVPWNASMPMKRDIVNPIPPRHAHPNSILQLTPSGSAPRRSRTARTEAPRIPKGLSEDQAEDDAQRHRSAGPAAQLHTGIRESEERHHHER